MTDFNVEPYWDDFASTNGARDKNYMRIMFRPGYAVQARELTQIQSILQNQIKQFGDHVFKDGSPVIGGQLSLDTSVTYIKIEKQFNGIDVDLPDFVGLTVFNTTTPRSRARVVKTSIPNAEDRVLLIKYLRGTGFSAGQTITTTAGLNSGQGAKITSTSSFTGKGSTISINEGIFYVNGFFVNVSPQTIVLDPYSSSPTYRVGLEIDESFVDENEDSLLLDPAQNSFNFLAPGASRYKFNLVLSKRSIDSVDDRKFFELVRVENGIITRQVQYPVYSELEKTFARRTFDESGNYTVRPFRVNLSANTDNGVGNTDTFIVNIEPGKAYVKGFEFETIGTRRLTADRARTYQSSVDYNLSSYYGNRIIITDVKANTTSGINLSSTPQEVDIHCVPVDKVNLTGQTQKYFSTRIGTAKLKNFDRVVSNDYHAYLIDVKFDSIFGSANTNSSATNVITLPAFFSDNSLAYVGATITMIDRFPGESRLITGYDGSGKLARLDQPFASAIQSGDRFTLTIPLASTESIIRANSSFGYTDLSANVAFSGKSKKDEAIYEDSNFQTSLYELPYLNIKRKDDEKTEIYLRSMRTFAEFTSNGAYTMTTGGAEEGVFDFGPSTGLVSKADIAENIIVVAVTGANAGQIIDMTAANRSVIRNSPTSVTLYTENASGSSFRGDVYITTKQSNAQNYRKAKTLVQSASLLGSNNSTMATSVIGYSGVKVDLTRGIAWYRNADVINKIPGEKQSLYVGDVAKIKKIYDSGSISTEPTDASIDVTDRYIFDSGQTDNYYNHASIILKPGAQPPSGQTAILFDYFQHNNAKGYISAKSYEEDVYNSDKIPIYVNKSSKTYNLRDCIDLRPLRSPGTSTQPTKFLTLSTKVDVAQGSTIVTANTTGIAFANAILSPPIQTGMTIRVGSQERKIVGVTNSRSFNVATAFSSTSQNSSISIVTDNFAVTEPNAFLHRPTDPIQLNFDFYLPRIDKVVITKDKDFKIIQGIPDIDPEEPVIDQDMMEIYKLKIPAYTASLESINYQFVDNRRYTMRDIADLEKRIKNIENFVSLKKQEETTLKNPPQSGGIDKPIYGMIVDNFDNLIVADQTKDFASSIELSKLSCYRLVTPLKLKARDPDSVNLKDKFVTLPYTEIEMVSQKVASNKGNTQVQTAVIAKGEGFVTLSPESDFFYSLSYAPWITDSTGRWWQLQQTSPSNEVPGYGKGSYPKERLEEVRLLEDYGQIQTRNKVTVPNPFVSNATTYEPTNTVNVDLNHAGVYYKQQEESWANKGTIPSGGNSGGGPNSFDDTWLLRGFLTESTDYYQQQIENKVQGGKGGR